MLNAIELSVHFYLLLLLTLPILVLKSQGEYGEMGQSLSCACQGVQLLQQASKATSILCTFARLHAFKKN